MVIRIDEGCIGEGEDLRPQEINTKSFIMEAYENKYKLYPDQFLL